MGLKAVAQSSGSAFSPRTRPTWRFPSSATTSRCSGATTRYPTASALFRCSADFVSETMPFHACFQKLFVNHSAVHYTFTLHRAFPRPPLPPPPHLPPAPNPAPAPPEPGTTWDCHPHTATPGLGLKDTDLTEPPFGTATATAEDCEATCNGFNGTGKALPLLCVFHCVRG